MTWEITNGDCLDVMRTYPDNHFSGIVTDPPYGLSFMNKGWDYEVPDCSYWEECLRITKPGSFLIAMGGTRTFHRLACAIEEGGYEIRDCILWLYASGFPKGHNHFGIDGFGTTLKPAWEPCIVAMKPCDGTFKQNAEKWGQAGINIDGCKIGSEAMSARVKGISLIGAFGGSVGKVTPERKGRWPANVILDEVFEQILVLKDSIPNDIISVIQEYFHDYKLPNLPKRNKHISESNQKEQSTILQSSLLQSGSDRKSERESSPDERSETSTRIDCRDEKASNQDRQSESSLQGLLVREGVQVHQSPGVVEGTFSDSETNDYSIRNPRTSNDNGCLSESSFKEIGSGTPSQWSEGRQQNREFGDNGQFHTQNGTQGHFEGIESIETGKRTIKVLACDVPEKWMKYFEPNGEEIRSPHCAGALLDEMSGTTHSSNAQRNNSPSENTCMSGANMGHISHSHKDSGGASRFFYCAKASARERNEGLDCYITVKHHIDQTGDLWKEENIVVAQLLQRNIYGLTDLLSIDVFGENITAQFHKDSSSIIKTKIKQIIESKTSNLLTLSPTNEFIRDVASWMEIGSSRVVNAELKNAFQRLITNGVMVSALGVSIVVLKMLSLISDEGNWKENRSTHPTVKPLSLMRYLITLIAPPSNALILDPFAGSGTTILAAHQLGISALGIEQSPEYCEIARARLQHSIDKKRDTPEQLEFA